MTVKLNDLTKQSKWKTTKEVPFYPLAKKAHWMISITNSTANAPVGTEFTVPDKRDSGTFGDHKYNRETHEYEFTWEASGTYFVVQVQDQKGLVFFSDIKDCIELLEKPADLRYYIRDKNSGLFYVTEKFRADDVKKNEVLTTHPTSPDIKTWYSHKTVDVRWAKTPGSGKTFKNAGYIKSRVLMISGYYNGMDCEMDAFAPIAEIPESWEAVEYDKSTGNIKVLDINLHEYTKYSFGLRDLTIKFGSASRDLYKKLEKSGELDEYKYFLMFNPGDVYLKPNSEYMKDELSVLEDIGKSFSYEAGAGTTLKKSVQKEVKALLDKDDKRSIKNDSICVALKDECRAFELLLAYTGDLCVKQIDICTLQEVLLSHDEIREVLKRKNT